MIGGKRVSRTFRSEVQKRACQEGIGKTLSMLRGEREKTTQRVLFQAQEYLQEEHVTREWKVGTRTITSIPPDLSQKSHIRAYQQTARIHRKVGRKQAYIQEGGEQVCESFKLPSSSSSSSLLSCLSHLFSIMKGEQHHTYVTRGTIRRSFVLNGNNHILLTLF